MLTTRGADGLQLTDVAAEAGVTRQFLYKFFDGRSALFGALLADFVDALRAGFAEAGMRVLTEGALDTAAHEFVLVVCDTIEEKGTGAWHLLATKDPEIAGDAHALLHELVAPWHGHIARATGGDETDVRAAAEMILAAGRAALDMWLRGEAERDRAVDYATSGIGALLSTIARRER